MTLSNEAIRKLNAPLDMRRVHRREGSGGKKFDYMASHDIIRTANAVFDYGGWGTETVSLVCIGEHQFERNGKSGWRVGYRATVRLTVAGCVPTDGTGYGDATEYTDSPITAHELAVKEAESDAEKRAFRKFGDQFGLILWAKEHERASIEKVARVRAERTLAENQAAVDALKKPDAPAVAEIPVVVDESIPQGTAGLRHDGDTVATIVNIDRGIPDHALPFVLPETVLGVVIDQIGSEKTPLIEASWLSLDARTLETRLVTQDDASIVQFCGHVEATHKARKGVLKSVKARLDKLAAPEAPKPADASSEPQSVLDVAMKAAEAAGREEFVDPEAQQEFVQEVEKEFGGPFMPPAPRPEATPLMRLRALVSFVRDQPSCVPEALAAMLSSEEGVLKGIEQSGWGAFASLDALEADDTGPETINAVWMAAPVDVRAVIEGLSVEDCAALADESI